MKHLKLFENKSNHIWIVVGEYVYEPERNHHELFYNEDDAILCYINNVNDIKQELTKKNTYDIINLDDADNYVGICSELGFYAYYYDISINDKYDIPDELKIAMNAKKYNI